jgi:hypothetical protein
MPSPCYTATEIWQRRYELAVEEFKSGKMSPDLFRGMMFRLGFRGSEINAEVNLHWPSKTTTKEQRQ